MSLTRSEVIVEGDQPEAPQNIPVHGRTLADALPEREVGLRHASSALRERDHIPPKYCGTCSQGLIGRETAAGGGDHCIEM